jgi:molybdopterin converting factor small subunit
MRILLFGRLSASLGREIELDLPGPRTVADVRRELARLYPHSAQEIVASRARPCINDAMTSEEAVVEPADEIAFLPPLSGG